MDQREIISVFKALELHFEEGRKRCNAIWTLLEQEHFPIEDIKIEEQMDINEQVLKAIKARKNNFNKKDNK